MELWSIVQETFITACVIIGGIFAVFVGFGVLVALLCWVVFLLKYPMGLMFWICEKMLPPSPRKEERSHRREPEPPPPPPSITCYAPCINETQKPIQEAIKECLRSTNDEQIHTR